MKKYKVQLFMDSTYEVIEIPEDGGDWISKHQGSLADCEAWIRLVEGGYLNA